MHKTYIFIFFSIVLTVYSSVNIYIFSHGLAAVKGVDGLTLWYSSAYAVVSLSWIAGRLLERRKITFISTALIWFGSFWLAAMVYFLVLVVIIDLIRLVNAVIPIVPAVLLSGMGNFTILVCAVVLVAVINIAGAINARYPRVKPLNLNIAKNPHLFRTLKIVSVSDIHLGTIISRRRLERIVGIINSLDADLVLLPGDIVDEDIGPVIKQNLGETLRKIKSHYGVFAVTGNHEYIGGVEAACKYLTEHGIRILRDEVETIGDSVVIIGREDVSFNRAHDVKRKSIEQLLGGVDRSLPLILMDHQPFRLHEAEQQGIDLQISGHTHHGQIWPFNLITRKIFEVSWGYKRKGNTHIYVSCGAGSWGPPVRIGNTPEIMMIQLNFG